MKCIVSKAEKPVLFESCGNLISEDHFVHMRRVCDSFVLLAVRTGTLYITQGGRPYEIEKIRCSFWNRGSNITGTGHRRENCPTTGCIFGSTAAMQTADDGGGLCFGVAETSLQEEYYVIPGQCCLRTSNRVTLLMVQLLDMARRDNFIVTRRTAYAASLVLLELTQEYLRQQSTKRKDLPTGLNEVMEWIQAHYGQNLTAVGVAHRFGYNPTYLSALFKTYTGYPLIAYVNRLRISVSKNLLTNRALKIYTIASMCGFSDEKHYMKLFKRYEGMTPSQYRQAFFQKKIN